MIITLIVVSAFIFFFVGFMVAHLKLQKRIDALQLLLKADKQVKILTDKEKEKALQGKEAVGRLDFESLLENMEQKYTSWVGHRHQRHVGIWINWIRCILDKESNTKRL